MVLHTQEVLKKSVLIQTEKLQILSTKPCRPPELGERKSGRGIKRRFEADSFPLSIELGVVHPTPQKLNQPQQGRFSRQFGNFKEL